MSRNILHIVNELGYGGTERFLISLLTDSRLGKNSSIVSLTKLPPDLTQNAHLNIYSLNIESNPLALLQLPYLIYRLKPDCICTWSYYTDLVGFIFGQLLFRKNVIWNIRRSVYKDEVEPWYRKLIRKVLEKLSSYPRTIVFNSYAGLRSHQEIGYKPKKHTIIPNGVDVARFSPSEKAREKMRCHLAVSSSHVVVGCVARNSPVKGYKHLIRTISELHAMRNVELKFCFVGKNVTALLPYLQEHNLQDYVLLHEPNLDIHSYYNAFDLFVLASQSEGFPNVIAEAMSCGVPCVATDAGDARLIIGDTGQVVPTGDSKALSQALGELILLPEEERKAMGIKARARIIESFPLSKSVDAHLKVLESHE